MPTVDRYLLRSEKCLAQVRRHWAILIPQFSIIGAAWIVWLVVLGASPGEPVQEIAASFFILSATWLGWLWLDWNHERFAVTDKRVLLVSGLFTTRLAVMPLSKVTDMTYERSPTGRLFGYGTFIMESAGQDQALSRVDFVQHPERLYFKLTEELFGVDDWSSRDDLAPHPPPPPGPPGRRAALREDPRLPARLREMGRAWSQGRRERATRRSDRAASADPSSATPTPVSVGRWLRGTGGDPGGAQPRGRSGAEASAGPTDRSAAPAPSPPWAGTSWAAGRSSAGPSSAGSSTPASRQSPGAGRPGAGPPGAGSSGAGSSGAGSSGASPSGAGRPKAEPPGARPSPPTSGPPRSSGGRRAGVPAGTTGRSRSAPPPARPRGESDRDPSRPDDGENGTDRLPYVP